MCRVVFRPASFQVQNRWPGLRPVRQKEASRGQEQRRLVQLSPKLERSIGHGPADVPGGGLDT